MFEFIIKRLRMIEVANVQCTNCKGEFFKVLNRNTPFGKKFNYCPLCGCKIEDERYKK